jgi:large subunit ribosomal protein L17
MVTFLLERGRLETTVTRAKELKAAVERVVTIGKTPGLCAKRKAFSYITKEEIVKKLFEEIAPKYADVCGGCTRITRLGARRGDAAEMAAIELI